MPRYTPSRENRNFQLDGFKHGLNMCCTIFFYSAWWMIRHEIPEYGKNMHKLTNNAGVILCPDCLVSTMDPKHDDL